jgi:hypothetical protein
MSKSNASRGRYTRRKAKKARHTRLRLSPAFSFSMADPPTASGPHSHSRLLGRNDTNFRPAPSTALSVATTRWIILTRSRFSAVAGMISTSTESDGDYPRTESLYQSQERFCLTDLGQLAYKKTEFLVLSYSQQCESTGGRRDEWLSGIEGGEAGADAAAPQAGPGATGGSAGAQPPPDHPGATRRPRGATTGRS